MSVLPPPPIFRAADANGAPLAGGKLYTYAAGTTTPLATYTDQGGLTANTNPVILDANGQANVWLGTTGAYKFVLTDADDVVQWTVDNIDPSAYSNDALLAQAIVCFAGALPPDSPSTGQLWYDTTNSTLWQYNGTLWDAVPHTGAFVSQTYTAFTSAGTAPAFTLAPTPAITAYVAGQRFRWHFHAGGTTGSNTGNISGLGAKSFKQYDSTGALVDGDIKSGMLADVEYDGTDLVILNPLPAAGGGAGGYENFRAVATGADATITMTAARVTLRDASGNTIEVADVSETLTITNTGAGGLDSSESVAASTWYYYYFIHNPATGDTAALASPSATAPTLPTGYTHYRRMGALRTDATANKYPLRMAWSDDSAEYRPYNTGSNLTDWPTIQTGALGTLGGTPTFSAVAVTSFFPPTASRIRFLHGNEYGQSGSDQIGIESGTDGSYALSCAEGGGGKRLVEINYIASIGVAAQSGTEVMAVGWVDHGGSIYEEE